MRPLGSGCLSSSPVASSASPGSHPSSRGSPAFQLGVSRSSSSSLSCPPASPSADQLRAQVAALAKALHEDRRRRAAAGQSPRASPRPCVSFPVFYRVSQSPLSPPSSSASSPPARTVSRDTAPAHGSSASISASATRGGAEGRETPQTQPRSTPRSPPGRSVSSGPAGGGCSGALEPKTPVEPNVELLSARSGESERLRVLKEQVAHMQLLVAKKKEQEKRAKERWETRKRQRALWRQNIPWNRLVNTPVEPASGRDEGYSAARQVVSEPHLPTSFQKKRIPFADWAAAKASAIRKEYGFRSVADGDSLDADGSLLSGETADSRSALPERRAPWTTAADSDCPVLDSGNSIAPKFRNRSLTFCKFYNRFGYCRNGEACRFYHDRIREAHVAEPEHVVEESSAVCPLYLKGLCESTDCPLAHEAPVTPICARFLQGLCIQDACVYRHEFGAPQTAVAVVEGDAVVDPDEDALSEFAGSSS
ncbi:zinc finger (CCCH type) motif-containing protein [Toxoplasma gondii RUB]|uniref:Zinc finger (CCCH type) motif-containing protein n=1 Tax=Toxoplasma gondii RUB TaxID=935652 RepID=A0A086M2J7_TOXGO|nr:zinc finger (CCCH type) motif-containing protein [Toxoplasma gondii RUB]